MRKWPASIETHLCDLASALVRPTTVHLRGSEGHPDEHVRYFQAFRTVGEITNPCARERGTTSRLGTGSAALLTRADAERRQEPAAWAENFR